MISSLLPFHVDLPCCTEKSVATHLALPVHMYAFEFTLTHKNCSRPLSSSSLPTKRAEQQLRQKEGPKFASSLLFLASFRWFKLLDFHLKVFSSFVLLEKSLLALKAKIENRMKSFPHVHSPKSSVNDPIFPSHLHRMSAPFRI